MTRTFFEPEIPAISLAPKLLRLSTPALRRAEQPPYAHDRQVRRDLKRGFSCTEIGVTQFVFPHDVPVHRRFGKVRGGAGDIARSFGLGERRNTHSNADSSNRCVEFLILSSFPYMTM